MDTCGHAVADLESLVLVEGIATLFSYIDLHDL